MQFYTVHRRPAPGLAAPDLAFVKEGFSWPAFLAAPLWLSWRCQWLGLAAYFAGLSVLGALAWFLDETGWIVLAFGYHWLVGASANDWLRSRLSRAGYELVDVVAAADLSEAEFRILLDARPPVAAAPPVRSLVAMGRPLRATEAATPLTPWSP